MVKNAFNIIICAFAFSTLLKASEHELAVNSSLRASKCPKVSMVNTTGRDIPMDITYFHHAPLASGEEVIPTLLHLPKGVILFGSHSESACLTVTGKPARQALVVPSEDRHEHSAQVLHQKLVVPSGKSVLLGNIEDAYIAGIRVEDEQALFSYGIQEERISFQLSDTVRYLHPATVFYHNFAEVLERDAIKEPFKVNTPVADLLRRLLDFYVSKGAPLDGIMKRLQLLNTAGVERLKVLRQGNVSLSDLTIPMVTHTLLTKRRVPGEKLLSDQHKKWYEKTLQSLSPDFGWKHVLWTADPTSITESDLGSLWNKVEIRSFDSLASFSHATYFLAQAKDLIEKGAFHHASSIYKYFILFHLGGLTRGLDTEVIQPLTAFHKMFGFYASMNANTNRMLASGFVAARPQHPAIKQAMMITHWHLSQWTEPKTMSEGLCDYYLGSANAALTVALHRCGDPNTDMVFGPQVLNPLRPSVDCTSFGHASFSLSPATHGIHYAEVNWKKSAGWNQ